MTTQKQRQEGFLSRRSGESGANVVTARRLPIRLSLGAPRETEGLMPMTFARRAADGGLGMTANRTERETPQGPATSFVVACAFAPVAGALGYKLPA